MIASRNQRSFPLCGSRRGVALVITIACLVLATFLVLAFFSRAIALRQIEDTSARIVETDLLARTAFEAVTADIKAEMRAGSTLHSSDGVTVFQPSDPAAMLPQRVLDSEVSASDANFATLYKQSVGRFFPNSTPTNQNSVTPIIQATSGIATNTPSTNGRVVTGARWTTPKLLFGNTTFSNNQTPQWVLITRSGIPASQSWNNTFRDATETNQNFVIGRFAFNIYEVGGLLDANVAGYAGGVSAADLGLKGSLGLAALGGIPGVTNADTFVTNWRNKASGSSAANYLAYLGLSTATANEFFNKGPSTGFRKPAAAASGNSADSMVVGRQDLIRLAESADKGIDTTALPYLTHFTRELNAPSWGPTTPAGSTIDYAANANTPASANRFLPNVRVKAAFTRRDGSQAVVGEPLVTTRFPLSKLAWLGADGPVAPGTTATIQRDFGLSWDAANKRWNYVGHSGSTVQTAIKTLDQVATDNREPNFFEMLKAGILDGSVGKASQRKTLAATGYQTIEGDTDFQIARTGACLIDQADSDNFPSHIHLGGATQHGVEDLPYLIGVLNQERWRHDPWGQYPSEAAAQAAAAAPGGAPFTISLAFIWVPKLWNPHASVTTPTAAPSAIRARISAGQVVRITHIPFNASGGVTPLDINTPTNLPSNTIDIPSTSFDLFRTTARPPDGTFATSSLPSQLPWWNSGADTYCGFVIHRVNQQSVTVRSTGGPPSGFFANVETSGAMLVMEYLDAAGNWHVYDTFGGSADLPATTGLTTTAYEWDFGISGFWSLAQNRVQSARFSAKWDPRSSRWGPCQGWGWEPTEVPHFSGGSGIRRNKPFPSPLLVASDTPSLFGLWPQGNATANSGNNIPGADSVWRPNDAYKGDTANPFRNMADTARRPVILQRPFRSVGEMGHAFRDTPWQTLSFFDATSADSALLDLFCVSETPSITAGKVNLNRADTQVLKAVLDGAGKASDGTSAVDAANLAADVVAFRDAQTGKVIASRAALAQFVSSAQFDSTDASEVVKARREAVVRALADSTQTRTWNLLVDVIAQSGRYGVAASSLDKFVVEGERRCWLHLAIDRFTGEVIESQLEPVTE